VHLKAIAGVLLASVAAIAECRADTLETVVVTGTRAQGRTEENSPVPISVYDSARLANSGFVDLGRALDTLSPSVNVSHSQTSPSAANTRSITLKGMAPGPGAGTGERQTLAAKRRARLQQRCRPWISAL
jgi:iron complex outermembrane receptor protein